MDITYLFFQGIPFIVALSLGLLLPLAAFAQYRLAAHVAPDTRIIVLLLLMAGGAILTAVLTPRILNASLLLDAATPVYVNYGHGFMASRILNLFIVGASAVEILRGLLDSSFRHKPDPARPLLYALILFYFGIIFIHLAGSEHRGFSYKTLYVPMILIFVYYQRVENLDRILQAAKLGILACTAGSLFTMAVAPDMVMQQPEAGLIPGIDFRLFGLAPHPNVLGPMALLGIILELYAPSRWRWLRGVHLIAAFAVFALAQSKTVWLASIVILAIVYGRVVFAPDGGSAKKNMDFDKAVRVLLVCIAVLIVAASAEWVFDISEYIVRNVGLATLTGRTKIWEITLDAWKENMLFGYGPALWNSEFRAQYGMLYVGQAHNQFLQTLGDAGICGLLLLLGYLSMYIAAALRHFNSSHGIILMLLIMLLIQFVTEAPLGGTGPLSWYTFEHVLLVLLTCHFLRQGAEVRQAGLNRLVMA